MRARICVSLLVVVGLVLGPLLAPQAAAEGGTDPVYAHLTASQRHTYDGMQSSMGNVEHCYFTGRDVYNAYLGWLSGGQTRATARQALDTTRRICPPQAPPLGVLTKAPLFAVPGPYHDFVMDGLLVTAAENTLAYDIDLALSYDAHNATLQGEITAAALKARAAVVDLVAQRQRFRTRYGY